MSLSADTQFRMRSDESSVQRSVGAERPDPSSDVVKEFRRAMDTQTGAQNTPSQSVASQNAPQRQGESVDSLFRNFGGFEEAAQREGLRAGAESAGKPDRPIREKIGEKVGEKVGGNLGEKLAEKPADKAPDAARYSRSHDLESGGLREAAQQRPDASIESLFRDFSQLQQPQQTQQTTAAQAPAQADGAQKSILDPDSLNNLVSRILVNSPESGRAEVRLMLNDNVLRGTEISISRDLSGQLSVQISCKDPSSFQTLVASRNDLQQTLEQQERQTVNVTMTDSTDAGENDTRQRSRGLDTDEYGNPA